MDKREYKLEQLKARVDQEKIIFEQMKELLENPMVEMVLGTMFIAWFLHDPNGKFEPWKMQDLLRSFQSAGMGAGMLAIITAQQLGKSLPYLTETGVKLLPTLGGLLK